MPVDKYQEKRREILTFAMKYRLVINPSKGYELYIKQFFEFNACPCDLTRKACPCEQSLEEVKEQGHCRCRLFWKSLAVFRKTLRGKDEKTAT